MAIRTIRRRISASSLVAPVSAGYRSISAQSVHDAIEEPYRASRAWPPLSVRRVRARAPRDAAVAHRSSADGVRQLGFQHPILLPKKNDHIAFLALEPSQQRGEEQLERKHAVSLRQGVARVFGHYGFCSCRSQPHNAVTNNSNGNTSEVYVSGARSSFGAVSL